MRARLAHGRDELVLAGGEEGDEGLAVLVEWWKPSEAVRDRRLVIAVENRRQRIRLD